VKHLLLPLFILLPLLVSSPLIAGNLSLIEKRLIELDRLNKQVVESTEKLPENGSVAIEAKIGPGVSQPNGDSISGRKIEFAKKTVVSIDQKLPYTVQISASRSQQQCFRVAAMLRRAGYPAFTGALILKDQGLWHRIFVGAYTTAEEAEQTQLSLTKDEIDDTLIRTMPFTIQVGKIGSLDSHKQVRERLLDMQYLPYTSYVRDIETNATLVRLLLGAFETKEDSKTMLNTLKEKGFSAQVVVR
jgi:cell division septation protein DedD